MCLRCGTRHAQEHGHCRRCNRERGVTVKTNRELDGEATARAAARLAALPHADTSRQAMQPLPDAEASTRIVNGVEYLVVWHGGLDGAVARGLPLERPAEPTPGSGGHNKRGPTGTGGSLLRLRGLK